MSELTKEQAQAKLNELRSNIEKAMDAATDFADEHGLHFRYIPEHIGYYHGKGSPDDRGDDGDVLAEGQWEPSTWNSSSAFC